MERLIVFAGGIAAFAVLVRAVERSRRAPSASTAEKAPEAEPADSIDGTACARCGVSSQAAQLIPTPEGMMCERCYADAK